MVLSGYRVLAKSIGVDKLIFSIGSDRKYQSLNTYLFSNLQPYVS